MSDDQDKREPIQAPVADKTREVVRAVVEAGAGLVPGGGSLVRLYRTTHPPKSGQDRKQWQEAISARTNENTDRLDQHDQLLPRKIELAGVTAQLVTVLAREPGDGMRGKGHTLDDLCKLLPDTKRAAVQDAAFELNSYGLAEVERAIGEHWRLYLTQNFYEQFDHQVMDWQTITEDDARFLARLILEDETREWTPTLHAASGWDRRRFNPAFRVLLRFIPEGRISSEIQPDYPARSVSLLPEDHASLRRLIAA
jgi:hypothetical protein